MAIVLGLVAAFVVRQSLRKPPVAEVKPPPPPAPPGLVGVVIAAKNIPMNTQLQLSDMVIVNVPPDHAATKLTVRHPANGIGRIAKQNIVRARWFAMNSCSALEKRCRTCRNAFPPAIGL